MKVALVEKKPLTLKVSGVSAAWINSLRRSVEEVPVLAIDRVEFVRNDSALFDEFFAHRLGLIPLRAKGRFVPKPECKCKGKGCSACETVLTLKAKGPGMVYASQLKSKGATPVYPEMPLVLLEKDQEVSLTAYACLGKGIEHAKYTPGLAFHRAFPILKQVKKPAKKPIKISSDQLSLLREQKGNLIHDLLNESLECEGSYYEVEASESEFLFTLEGWGQLPESKIVSEAVKVLSENLKAAKRELGK